MTTQNRTKINKLISDWPKGTVYTASHLKKLSYNYDLIRFYKKSRWITPVGNGAYKLFNDTVEWYGGIYALQTQLGLSIHVGGKTALELRGMSHYLSEKISRCFLYGHRGIKLPQWFKNYHWNTKIHFVTTNLSPESLPDSFSNYPHRDFYIRISSPERAAMEMLYHIPEEQGFDEAQKIMENLFTLRPAMVQKLLENCKSIKVKRLFMYMAEKHTLPWVDDLNLTKVNFGSGERLIVRNGRLDKKYKITVPKETEL